MKVSVIRSASADTQNQASRHEQPSLGGFHGNRYYFTTYTSAGLEVVNNTAKRFGKDDSALVSKSKTCSAAA